MSDFQAAASKFPEFSADDVEKFVQTFKSMDADGSGSIDAAELGAVLRSLGEKATPEEVRAQIQEVDTNRSGTIEFNEFLGIISRLRAGKASSDAGFGKTFTKQSKVVTVGGSSDSIAHSFSEDEKESFVDHINMELGTDADIGKRFPLDSHDMSIFEAVKDGLLLCKLINYSVPDTIDERVLNIKAKLNQFEIVENQNVCINSAKAIGCNVVNVGAQDLMEGRVHLVLGLIWQIIKIGLLSRINLSNHPELYRLLEEGETLDDLLKLPVEQILIRWVNYHLKNAGSKKRIANFGSDIKDSEAYTILLSQLDPNRCTTAPLNESDLHKRAELVLQNADKLDPPCRKFVTPKAIVAGNPKLNLAFVANLFNFHPGLAPLSEEEKAAIDEALFGGEGDREARAFALWLNSLGIEPFVNNLYEDLKDGLVLLRAFDKISPGSVQWSKVNQNQPITSKFKRLENTNYAIVVGKSLKFSLVGVGGQDIEDGNKTLTLALVWQMMRFHVLSILKSISKDGRDISEDEMVAWANNTVKKGGRDSVMDSFKDPKLASSIFFLDLMNGIKKGIVNYDIVAAGSDDAERKSNAKYSISIARKLGACIFVLPEDIMEVKPKMILTFVGALMHVALAGSQ
ncbi:fimbrin [Capsaspora owczarzaki ATCC 30864]|uniref:Fimbrin n=1 Tax=Capsaspora owczarzaki (strain ATCC 30864) TaxID=595528 RepID=A0A0D2WVJ4_CAPO3|nr:fimbrin [Capsaspora owczarzaki ATCC 30864]KJE96233.1 fimbrin [Capsaspora owczarzaki ATCC 30864]|eukprot:XP_004345335.1 fimbrin [Capsaspora owczarzaki ATCC 30864]